MSKDTLELKKEYFDFKRKMMHKMEIIGIDHCFPYMLEQYFEDFEKALHMDKWEIPKWYDENSDLKKGSPAIVFKGMRKNNDTA